MSSPSHFRPAASFEVTALRLHLVVGMAAADGDIHPDELAQLRSFVTSADVAGPQRALLSGLLDRLIEQPPALDELLRSIVERLDRPELARFLVQDLVAIATVDGHVDPREEGLLRLVCGALEIDPVTLYDGDSQSAVDVSAADLATLVRSLLQLDDAA